MIKFLKYACPLKCESIITDSFCLLAFISWLQTHSFLVFFVILGLEFCKPHFSFAIWLPAKTVHKRQKAKQEAAKRTCSFSFCILLMSVPLQQQFLSSWQQRQFISHICRTHFICLLRDNQAAAAPSVALLETSESQLLISQDTVMSESVLITSTFPFVSPALEVGAAFCNSYICISFYLSIV